MRLIVVPFILQMTSTNQALKTRLPSSVQVVIDNNIYFTMAAVDKWTAAVTTNVGAANSPMNRARVQEQLFGILSGMLNNGEASETLDYAKYPAIVSGNHLFDRYVTAALEDKSLFGTEDRRKGDRRAPEIPKPETFVVEIAQTSSTAPVIKIAADGRLFWLDREVETDDDFRAAMIDLKTSLRNL